jgi:hypothetical protein
LSGQNRRVTETEGAVVGLGLLGSRSSAHAYNTRVRSVFLPSSACQSKKWPLEHRASMAFVNYDRYSRAIDCRENIGTRWKSHVERSACPPPRQIDTSISFPLNNIRTLFGWNLGLHGVITCSSLTGRSTTRIQLSLGFFCFSWWKPTCASIIINT